MKAGEKWIPGLLKAFTCLVFWGRAWQHLRWDGPYRVLFWDQELMEPLVKNWLGLSWQAYVTLPETDQALNDIALGFGVIYLILGIVVLLMGKRIPEKAGLVAMIMGTLCLSILALLYTKDKFYQIGQLLEFSIQVALPLLTWQAVYRTWRTNRFAFAVKSAIALTFIGHGLYAVGAYPVPGHFIQMTMEILPFDEAGAIRFLLVMGILDFLAVAGIFLPGKERPFLAYAIIWGFLTALARIVAHWSPDWPIETIAQWLHETAFRMGHGGLPLVLWIMLSLGNPQDTPLPQSTKEKGQKPKEDF